MSHYWFRTVSALALGACISPAWADDYQPVVNFSGGASSDYTSAGAELFMPVLQNRDNLAFLTLHGYLHTNSDHSGGLGLGFRHLLDDRVILGGHVSVDMRRLAGSRTLGRLSAGLELMTEKWDVRANYYEASPKSALLSKTSQLVSSDSSYGDDDVFLSGHGVFANVTTVDTIAVRRQREQLLDGWDLEVGYQLFEDLRLYGGYYDFKGEGGHARGPKARVEWALSDSLDISDRFRVILSGEYTDDDDRGSNMWAGIRISMPFGPTGRERPEGIRRRMTEQVRADREVRTQEFVRNAVHNETSTEVVQLSDPSVRYWFVDDRTPEGGDGSFEKPFSSPWDLNFADDDAGDIIFVYAGDGSGYDGALDLADGQKLIGEAAGLYWDGRVELIAPGERPVLRNGEQLISYDYVIALAADNQIEGIEIAGTSEGDDGVIGYVSGNYMFRDLVVRNFWQSVDIGDGEFSTWGRGLNLSMDASSGAVSISIINSEFTGNATGVAIDQLGDAAQSTLSVKISGTSFVDNLTGFSLNPNSSVYDPYQGTLDLGGGSLGSVGQNRIFANGTNLLVNGLYEVSAQQNFWQYEPDTSTFELRNGASVNTGNALATDPGPAAYGACPAGQVYDGSGCGPGL